MGGAAASSNLIADAFGLHILRYALPIPAVIQHEPVSVLAEDEEYDEDDSEDGEVVVLDEEDESEEDESEEYLEEDPTEEFILQTE